MNDKTNIPEGYRQNALGHLVHEDDIRDHDKLRDRVVTDLVDKAKALNKQLADYKHVALQDIEDLVAISAERYGVTIGGKKGNVTLLSFDGRYKVERNVRDVITLTEEIEAAKALIDKCIKRWSKGASKNIRAVVDQAFRANAQGQIKTSAVLNLLRMEIEDGEWHQAMDAVRDALQVVSTSTYVRIYERIGDSDQWKAITLDLASA